MAERWIRMAKMNKYATMDEALARLDDTTLADIRDKIGPLYDMAQEADEAREEALNSVGEAMSYHEERQWDDRNDALETAIERMNDFLDKYETLAAELSDLDGIAPAASGLEELRKHLEALEGIQ
jgi:rubrerythrin